ncbi:MAG TPA: hypothetical protein VFT29_03240 [Gemmatimonadaceae bacterium]|nr:hypothetical protein [Gemmatimonadaceae bacterium]
MKRSVVATVALVVSYMGLPRASAMAQENADADSTHWQWYVTPYGWASGMRGDVGVRGRVAHVDVSFSEILDHLDAGFMLPLEVRRGDLGLQLDLLYIKVSGVKATPGPLFSTADASGKLFLGEIAPLFRVLTTKDAMVDVLGGIRWWNVRGDLTLEPGILPRESRNLNKGWMDAIGGARGFYKIDPHWVLQGRGDIGALQSDFTWQLIGSVGYIINNTATVRAGYRQLDVDFDDGGDGFVFDVGLGGPFIGVTFRF